jgi:hypothetical protein
MPVPSDEFERSQPLFFAPPEALATTLSEDKEVSMRIIAITLLIVAIAHAATAVPTNFNDETRFLFALWGDDVTWVNFDEYPDGSPVPTGQTLTGDEWAMEDVIFSSPGNVLSTTPTGIGTASSPPNYFSISDTGTGNQNLTIAFDVPMIAVGFTLLGPDFAGDGDLIIFRAPDGGVVTTLPLPAASLQMMAATGPQMAAAGLQMGTDPSFFVGIISDGESIGSVDIMRSTWAGDPVAIDDVVFQVPEPSSIVLALLGCATLAWYRRRKHSVGII